MITRNICPDGEDRVDGQTSFRAANSMINVFESWEVRELVARRLSDAVKIPTITYDEMDNIDVDPRWGIFYKFSTFLRLAFSQIYEKLEVTTISQHGLLYTWQGSDSSLKPLLWMAHYDVVPVENDTLDWWTHPPFSGYYDGEFIWGRGSEDDKSNLIAMLTAIDILLSLDFTPKRTLIVSVGFDEEGGADQSYGARCLAEHLLKEYGMDSMEMIFDEGIAGIEDHWGNEFALPATAEKGYIDVSVTINTEGGHSSTPPDHTAIGLLAQVIQIIEDHPFVSQLTPANPTYTYLRLAAEHSREMPQDLRDAILNGKSSDKIMKYLNETPETKALIQTSTAVTVVLGGVKANALPESARIIVNHRVAVEDSIQAVKDHYISILTGWVTTNGFRLHAFGTDIDPVSTTSKKIQRKSSPAGVVDLDSHHELEPSPVADSDDPRFSWLSETLHNVFGEQVIVAPVMLTGNTDTKFFWNLSSQIFRMSPWRPKWDPRGTRMHTVDERMPIKGLMEMVRFYYEFVRVLDRRRM